MILLILKRFILRSIVRAFPLRWVAVDRCPYGDGTHAYRVRGHLSAFALSRDWRASNGHGYVAITASRPHCAF